MSISRKNRGVAREPSSRSTMVDITERQQLEEQSIFLSSAVRMSSDSIVISDLQGKIMGVNEATLRMYGTDDTRDLVGKESLELIAPGEREKALEGMREVLEKGCMKDREYHIVTKGGSKLLVEMSTAIVKNKDGKPIGFVGVSRDITGRRRAEVALRESEMKFRSLAEQSPNMIFINKMGRVVYANEQCETIMGYKKEEFYSPNFNFLTIIAPEYIDLVKTGYTRHMEGEETSTYEYTLLAKDGRRIEAILATKLIEYGGRLLSLEQ